MENKLFKIIIGLLGIAMFITAGSLLKNSQLATQVDKAPESVEQYGYVNSSNSNS